MVVKLKTRVVIFIALGRQSHNMFGLFSHYHPPSNYLSLSLHPRIFEPVLGFKGLNIHHTIFYLQGEQLALLALKRMARDKNNEVRLQYSTELEDNAGVDTFIATAISPTQRVSECYTLLEE